MTQIDEAKLEQFLHQAVGDMGAAISGGWEQHDERLFSGVGRLFRPSYAGYLTSAWIPALDGVEPKSRARLRCGGAGRQERRISPAAGRQLRRSP